MPLMHSCTLVNRPAGLIISSLGSFAFLMLNRISDIGNKGRLHLPVWTLKNNEEKFSVNVVISYLVLPVCMYSYMRKSNI